MFAVFKKKKFLEVPDAEPVNQPSMQRANTKLFRFWHFHTDPARAGPTRIQKYLCSRKSRILRPTVPNPPPPYTISNQWKATKPEVASTTIHIANELEQFLHTNYRTKSGFSYKKGSIDILHFLSKDTALTLLLRNPEGQICGCVLSMEQQGLFGFYGEKAQPSPRRIQYLCIHPMLRGRGLAGWLLGWLDTISHQTYGPCVHLGWWFAPTPSCTYSPFPSIVQTKLYKKVFSLENNRIYEYSELEHITATAAKRVIDELLSEEVGDWLGSSNGTYLGLYNIPTNQEIHWWKYTDEDLHGCSVLVGIVPTQLEAKEGQVWQVVYCSFVRSRPGNPNDISMPFWDSSHTYKYIPKTVIEMALKAQGVRVAILSDIHSHYGGGLHPSEWRLASHGDANSDWCLLEERSKLCIYNWMPPTFRFEDCLWIAPTL